ncbi:stage V sporulation protein D [Clostridium sp. LP20]|uniref:stage V sporulation protein D n=1 Tax=Clostridium sp. LP20 TaxID=3418665 RepID=UPI003EE79423
MKKNVFRDRALMKKRISVALIGITTLFFVLTLRLSYIMIVKRGEYAAMAEDQWTSEVKIDARRGRILDRNGVELAVSANVYRVDFDLNSIRTYLKNNEKDGKAITKTSDLAPLIADAVGMEKEDVQKKLDTTLKSGAPAGSATLIRRIEKDAADKVKALKVSGIIVSPDTKRYYPNGSFLAHVLGSTNTDNQGLTGIELKYNSVLSGVPGMKIAELDRQSGDLPYTISQFTPPVDGKDITLTIDERIQSFAERVAKQALNDQKAHAVSVTVMDPKTGEVLAMVNKPDFDPNQPYEGIESFTGDNDYQKLQSMWRNRIVSDTFEPGSIFKVVTSIAAMEENTVPDGHTFQCGGSTVIGGRKIKCWKAGGHGSQTFEEIIKNSCNVAFTELGAMIGKEKLNEYIDKFGFGKLSGVDLPGEARGIIKKTETITETDLATIAFGQTNTVNTVQYMAAFNAVANGGTLIQPHVMKEVSHKDENGTRVVDDNFKPTTTNVATSEKTAELRKSLERVVTEGSGNATFIEGYHIGGKTGTAQKVINGVYADGKYISSFVGMAPVDDPKVTVMITVDEPSNEGYYAGQVAAPYAKLLFTDIFNYMESKFATENASSIVRDVVIPEIRGKSVEEAKKALKEVHLEGVIEGNGNTVKSIKPYPGYTVKEGSKITLYTEGQGENIDSVIMPDVRGYSLESATTLLKGLGLKFTSEGTGMIDNQSIPPGELINKGTSVKLELSSKYMD